MVPGARSPWPASDGDEAGFGRVLERLVALAGGGEDPAVVRGEAEEVADLHASTLVGGTPIRQSIGAPRAGASVSPRAGLRGSLILRDERPNASRLCRGASVESTTDRMGPAAPAAESAG